jgi:hypothetical protein
MKSRILPLEARPFDELQDSVRAKALARYCSCQADEVSDE